MYGGIDVDGQARGGDPHSRYVLDWEDEQKAVFLTIGKQLTPSVVILRRQDHETCWNCAKVYQARDQSDRLVLHKEEAISDLDSERVWGVRADDSQPVDGK